MRPSSSIRLCPVPHRRLWLRCLWICICLVIGLPPHLSRAADSDVDKKKLDRVVEELTFEKVWLAYKYREGEQLRYRVEHVSATDTRIDGVSETSKSRSESIKVWQVTGIDAQDGTMQFEHRVEGVEMWQEVSGQKGVRYNSRTDKEPPALFANIAKSINVPLAEITLTKQGQVLARRDLVPQIDLGLGGTSIPLPESAVGVGHEWSVPIDLRVRDSRKQSVLIKTRQLYRLTHLSAGVATITLKTQILTPIRDQSIRSQIVQRLSNGELRFDVDAGRLLRRELNWDETVIGFSGQGSNMKFMARLTETLEADPGTDSLAATPADATRQR